MNEKRTRKDMVELTDEQKARIERLKALPDEEIDNSDIPVILDLKNARRGMFYRPVKRQITLRLDPYAARRGQIPRFARNDMGSSRNGRRN